MPNVKNSIIAVNAHLPRFSSTANLNFLKDHFFKDFAKSGAAGVAEWFTVPCLLRAARMVVGSSPGPNPHQCLWTHLQVGRSKRLGCHAGLYTVSRCHTSGEYGDHTSKKARKGDQPRLWNPGQTSPKLQNRGISGPTKGTHVPQKFILKKRKKILQNLTLR